MADKPSSSEPSPLTIEKVQFEHHPTGYGVPVSNPRLSWRYTCPSKVTVSNWAQKSYEVEIRRGSGTKTYNIESADSSFNLWPDSKPLTSRETADVRVRGHGMGGVSKSDAEERVVSSEWSPWCSVEAGLLSQDDWSAKFITTAADERGETGIRPFRLRKVFELPAEVAQKGGARLYITALGLYEAYLNGERVGREQMAPGWTSYSHRLQYQRYDVSALLKSGVNTLAVEVAEGWYAGRFTMGKGLACIYGDEIGAIAQLEAFASPEDVKPSFQLLSDETWVSHPSPLLSSEIYDGEAYDIGQEDEGWSRGEVSSSREWKPVKILQFPRAELLASPCPPVHITEEVKPVSIFRSPSGKTLIDFGQNLVGKVCIGFLRRPEGHRLQLRHAEVLEHGELATRPLRFAKQTDTIVFGGKGELKDWSPHFTFHGFRYIEVEGWSPDDDTDPLTKDSVSALVMHTDMERTGFFECSDELVNRLHQNVLWSMRGNFLSIPTDCPQRDERMGWTGDIQVFTPTASFLYDCNGMLSNWMRDLIVDQKDAKGIVPLVIPNCVAKNRPWGPIAQAIWDDAVILVPWALYSWFGDAEVLRQSYPGMRDHLDKAVPRTSDGLWSPDVWQLGDWLDPNAPPDTPGLARTDGTLVADEYLVHVTGLVSKIAAIIGRQNESERYAADHSRLKKAFQAKYLAPSGLLVADSQTGLALALTFALLGGDSDSQNDELKGQRAVAASRLTRLVRYAKFHVSTGFAGTPEILHALSSTGHLQLAYGMLLEKTCPSWLYPVSMGATTIWERWDSLLPDGTVNPGQMTSFNHYALGAVANWLHTVVGGVKPLAPGWRVFRVEPRPGGDITSAKVEFLSTCGWVRCEWKISETGSERDGEGVSGDGATAKQHKRFRLALTVPANSTAWVVLPDGKGDQDRKGEKVGSGDYVYECDYTPEGQWPPKPLLAQLGR